MTIKNKCSYYQIFYYKKKEIKTNVREININLDTSIFHHFFEFELHNSSVDGIAQKNKLKGQICP